MDKKEDAEKASSFFMPAFLEYQLRLCLGIV